MSTSRRRQVQHQVWHQGKQKRWTPIVANNPKLHRSTVKVAGSHLMILIPANSNKSQPNVALSVKLHTTKRVQPVRSFRSGPEHKKIFRKNPNYSRVQKKNSECLACLNHCLTPERLHCIAAREDLNGVFYLVLEDRCFATLCTSWQDSGEWNCCQIYSIHTYVYMNIIQHYII